MIAACPKCTARYRVDESRIGPEGAKLRCAKCQALFRVLLPPSAIPSQTLAAPTPAAPEPAPVIEEAPPEPTPAPLAEASAAVPDPAAEPGREATADGVDRERLVVVADPSVDAGKATVARLSSWGLQPILVHDGVEAMLTIQRMLPRVVVLDAALPKMYGFQVCEVIKRNESLRDTGVVLVGAVHNQDRYRRQPGDLYGADHYIEQPDLPEGLEPLLQQMGVELRAPATPSGPPEASEWPTPAAAPDAIESGGTPAPAMPEPLVPELPALEMDAPAAAAVEAPAPPAPAAPDDGASEERANAERLARIIVSDIALYQPERFAAAIEAGNPVEAMDGEIEEGRVLFAQRIPEHVRAERDFIVEELLRVARERGMC